MKMSKAIERIEKALEELKPLEKELKDIESCSGEYQTIHFATNYLKVLKKRFEFFNGDEMRMPFDTRCIRCRSPDTIEWRVDQCGYVKFYCKEDWKDWLKDKLKL